ncbi:plasmid replication/partition related protein [Variovorax dokdonensis]|uniref:Plasmid replication/partition related protein n=1 Tax=Variovorax dokdonensis TaxID=344883 RepID=A0ABT7N4N1_9BURK|nr:plasmid replication/partition related protein [Variovorax dokdonensis]MDM0042885.1 plasmid replication/partition related protein [Variovorax dokdonensis]
MNTDIVVNEELKAYIDPLTADEYESLERSLLAEGCRDALVLWGDVLVDGHNRYAICQKHGLPFNTVQNTRFKSMEDVHLWMIDQHLGRRSVSDFQRGVLALRKREIVAERRARAAANVQAEAQAEASEAATSAETEAQAQALATREALARVARLSNTQVAMIEKIQKQATPELVAAVKAGDISINGAAAVASLPAEEQVAAATAGKDELKQAAKRVREAKRKPRETSAAEAGAASPKSDADDASAADASGDTVESLRKRVAELTAENTGLRKQVMNLLDQLNRRPSGTEAAPQDEEDAGAPF